MSEDGLVCAGKYESGVGSKRFKVDEEKIAVEARVQRQVLMLAQKDGRISELETKLTLAEVRSRHRHEELTAQLDASERRAESAQLKLNEQLEQYGRVKAQLCDAQQQLASSSRYTDNVRRQLQQEFTQRQKHHVLKNNHLSEELSACRAKLAHTETQLLQTEQQHELQLIELRQQPQRPLYSSTTAEEAQFPSSPTDGASSEEPTATTITADTAACMDNGGGDFEQVQAQLESAHKRIQELESSLSRCADDIRLGQLMKQQLASYSSIQRENRQMKDELATLRGVVDRTMLLEEQLKSAECQLARLTNCQQQLVELQSQTEADARELSSWRDMASQCCTDTATTDTMPGGGMSGGVSGGAASVGRMIAELRRQQLLLTDDLRTSQTEADEARAAVGRLEQKLSAAEQQLKSAEQQLKTSSAQLKRLQRKHNLVVMERDSLKSVISSYESETSVTLTSIEKQKVDGLQRCLDESRRQLQQLELQLADQLSTHVQAQSSSSTAPALHRKLSDQLDQARDQLRQLRDENDALRDEIDERAMRGDFNPAKTRVLCLRENPAASATQSSQTAQLERLRRENSTLQKHIDSLTQQQQQQQQQQSSTSPAQHTDSHLVTELQAQLRAAVQRASRLKQVFSDSVQRLRRSVHQLTGWRLSCGSRNQLKLRSIFSQQPSHYLHFQREGDSEGGGDVDNEEDCTVNLLETEMSAEHQTLVEKFLWRQDSIPCFLAALQLRLFEEAQSQSNPPADGDAGQDRGEAWGREDRAHVRHGPEDVVEID